MKPIRLMAAFFTVGAWTMASRILGFARDMLIAAYLGAGPVAEAFLIAFSLPNMFRRFFAEGAFNTAFVPLFSKKVESGDDPQGFASDAMAMLGLIVALFSVAAVIFMPALVVAMASGFVGDVRFDLAVSYGRIAFPYILFISLAALLSGVLNAIGHFAAAAAAPVVLNMILIAALLIASVTGFIDLPGLAAAVAADVSGSQYGVLLAWGVVLGGVAQVAIVWIAARRAGMHIRLRRPRLTPELKRLAIIAGPAALAGGVVQINLLIGRQVASFFDGAVAWLNYADRLYQLPLGVVGIAIGVVLLPDLSRRLGAGDTAGGRDALNRAAEISLALTIPAAVALVVIPMPLVSTLFQRGEFGADDTAATALAVAVYGLGLPAFVLQKVLQPLFFARENTRSPFYYALVSLAVNAGIALGLAPVVGFIAAALGTTVAGWGMVFLLWRGSRRMGEAATTDDRFRRRTLRIVLASAVMGVVLWGMNLLLGPLFGAGALRYVALLLLVLTGMATYFGVANAVGGLSIADIRRTLRR